MVYDFAAKSVSHEILVTRMMYNTPWWLGNATWGSHPFFGGFILLALWSAIWTGLALWNAAKRDEKGWFIFFMIVHTAGIVEILYLIFVVKFFEKKKTPRRKSR